jgi:hypothetical protein
MEKAHCHDCGCEEGQLHELGCDMERCPFCTFQLLSCDCIYEQLGLFNRMRYTEETAFLPPTVYFNGVNDRQQKKWEAILNKKGRIPYIEYPVICAKCGLLWPKFFRVPDEDWKHYIQPDMQGEVLCFECYQFIKQVIDEGQEQQSSQPDQRSIRR